jgi:hypothetical protein
MQQLEIEKRLKRLKRHQCLTKMHFKEVLLAGAKQPEFSLEAQKSKRVREQD